MTDKFQILVDADACPRLAKELLYRVAERRRIPVTLVSNQYLTIPEIPGLKTLQVGQGFDVADARIVELAQSGDLVITADIPLADLVVKKGATGLNPRGELYTTENIGSLLSVRDFMADMRDAGGEFGGPAEYGPRDKQAFANALDTFLARRLR